MKRGIIVIMTAILFQWVSPNSFAQNYGLNFSGSDDYVAITSNFGLGTGAHSIECWVFIPTTSEKGTFTNVGDAGTGYAIGVGGTTFDDTGNKLIVIFNLKAWYATTTDIGTGWHHVAYTYNGSTSMLIYLDGKQVDSKTVVTPYSPNNTTYIGSTITTTRPFTTGKIDEVRIWSEVRTEANLKAWMYKELAGNETNLAAYYKMSDGSGTTLTSNKTSGGANGTITGASWQASGNFSGPRQALDVDGTNDYIPSAITFSSAAAITIEGWIYPRTFNPVSPDAYISNIAGYDGGSCLLRIGDNAPGVLQANDRLQFVVNSSNKLSSATQLSANTWYHVAAVFDGTTMYLYLNGVLDCSTTISSTTVTSSGDFRFGGSLADNARYLDGLLDEFRIWTSARTATQIRENMMNTLAGNESGLAAYYRCDQTDGSTLYDITSNAKNGTLTNMDPATDWVASSAFNTWIGGESSAWSTAANWSRNAVPGSTDNTGLYKNTIGNHPAISGSPTVNHLLLSAASYPTKSSGMTVNGNMLLNVDYDLGGYTVTLGSSALLDEGSNRVYGTSGTITTTRDLNNISARNIGGLGATITTIANMGSTVITREHVAQTQGNGNSILRFYDITPTTNTGLNATLVFNYNENELNSLTEANLRLYKSTNSGTTWTDMGGTLSTSANTITLTGQDGFSRWTAGDAGMGCTNPSSGGTIAASQSIFSGQTPSAFTSSAAASGYNGTLEYKWQLSTTSSSSGFSDIASSNSATYTPGALTTTTWYKRLARVTCTSDWTGAAESNVLTVTVNSVTPVTGITTFDLSFNGTDSYVNCGNFSNDGWTQFTLSAWIKYNGTEFSGFKDLVSKHSTFRLYTSNSGVSYFSFVDSYEGTHLVSSTSSISVVDGYWHHLAAVFDQAGSTLKIYVDGVATSQSLTSPQPMSNNPYSNLTIGGYIGEYPYPSTWWNGEIDEVQIWNTARTEAEIKADMYRESGTNANLKAYYKMSDGMGSSLTDNSGNSNTGTLTNSPAWKASGCFSGPRQALNFDGADKYVSLPAKTAYNTTNFTVEFWVKANSGQAGNFRGIVDKGRYTGSGASAEDWYFITYAGNGVIIFGCPGLGEVWFGTDGNWHHIVGTYDGTTLRGYIDGALDNDIYTGTRSTPSANGITIGRTQNNEQYFSGQVEELRIWNTARSAAEIRENMFRPLAGNETGLVSYYRFDCKDGTTLYDLAFIANNGTLTNMDGSTDWVASTAFNTWIGSENSAWSTAKNWSSGSVPASTDNVGIYKWNDLSYENTLSGSPSVGHLLFSSSAAPTVSTMFTASGTVLQNINLTLIGDGSVTNSAANYVVGSGKTLTIPYNGWLTATGSLVNEGTITINSTSSGTGSLIPGAWSGSGTFTMQRYVASWTDASHGWHQLSSPVASQSIQPGFVPDPPTANEDVYSWNEVSDLWINTKSSPGTWNSSFESSFTTGKGYLVAYGPSSVVAHQFSGTPNTGDISKSGLTYTDASSHTGWNFLGNPYPSALYWNKTAWNLSNIDATAKVWVETNASYTDIAAGTGIIPAAQGFMVHVSSAGTGSLTIDASDRTHSAQNWYKDNETNTLKIMVFDPEGKTAQESMIRFNSGATNGFDPLYDSRFLAGYAPQFYSKASGINLSTNTLPQLTEQLQIPFFFKKNDQTSFYLEMEGMATLNPALTVFLTDLTTGASQNMSTNPVYYFTSSDGDNPERFLLHFKPVGVNEVTGSQQAIRAWTTGRTLQINNPAGLQGTISILSSSGVRWVEEELSGTHRQAMPLSLPDGVYLAVIQTAGQIRTFKVIVK